MLINKLKRVISLINITLIAGIFSPIQSQDINPDSVQAIYIHSRGLQRVGNTFESVWLTDKKVKLAVKVVKDDLKKIEGIGPKIAEILNSKGIVSFSDLAKGKVENIKRILEEAGPKFNVHEPSTWPTQAALAAKGKWDELKKLQDELNAGKSKK